MSLPKPLIPGPEVEEYLFHGPVSVIIAAYNCAATLPRSIESLKNQSYPHIEIIVCDDASTDDTRDVVSRLGVAYLRREKNGGAALARNDGARAATGEVLVFVEADGYYDPDYIEKIVRYLHLPEAWASINLGRRVWTEKDNALVRHQNDLFEAQVRRVLAGKRGTGAWAFKREAFWKMGGYDPACVMGQDADLVRRIIQAGGRTVIGDRSILHHKDPDTLRAYMRRGYRGGLHSIGYRERWHGMDASFRKVAYLIKFLILIFLPLYPLLGIIWHPGFFALFVAGVAFLILEDRTTFFALRIALARRDKRCALSAPVLLYLRRLAIGAGRIKSFFPGS